MPPHVHEIRTDRLLLRAWRESDREPFAALNADPAVAEHFPAALTREQSDEGVDAITRHFDQHGFGLWAVEVAASGDFAGFVGLNVPTFEAHFTPCVEIGWRLARSHWGHGYATEAARASLRHGFEVLELEEIVALTVPANRRSIAVMERIGMTRDHSGDFDHPRIAEGSPLRRHVLYRITPQQHGAVLHARS